MKSYKMLKISDERTVFIIQNEDGSYISQDNLIKYKNVGVNFDHRLIQEAYVDIDPNQIVNVLDAAGKAKFHFPLVWLDVNYGRIAELQEGGLVSLG